MTISAALGLALFAAFPVEAQGWKTFTSSRLGFSVQYPSDWVSDVSPDRLGLFSDSRKGFNAVVIVPGQAQIVVVREDLTSIDDVIATQRDDDDRVLSQRTITSDIGNCKQVREVVSRTDFSGTMTPVRDGVPQQTDIYYCGGTGDVARVIVTYWADDKNQAKWRAIARKMVASLKLQH